MKFKIKSSFNDIDRVEEIAINIINNNSKKLPVDIVEDSKQNNVKIIIKDENLPEDLTEMWEMLDEFDYLIMKIKSQIYREFETRAIILKMDKDASGISIYIK